MDRLSPRPPVKGAGSREAASGGLLSSHARTRMQQRGISAAALDALLDFGRVTRAGRGRELVFLDRKARERLARAKALAAGEAARVSNSYAIVGSDGTVITVGHRFRRIPRGR